MKYILNQREMQAVDRYSIEKIGIPSLVLMERAAAAVADCMKGCLKAVSYTHLQCPYGEYG